MLLVCGYKSFILMDMDNHEDFMLCAGTSRDLSNVKTLLFKWFQYYPRRWQEGVLESSVRVYIIDVPFYSQSNANYNNREEFYFDYIVTRYNLFGFERCSRSDVLC